MTIPRQSRALFACWLWAACPASAQTAAPGIIGGQLVNLLLGMLLVLAIIGGVAWLLKRLTPAGRAGSGLLRVVAGAAVGPRERVVVVEIGTTWLVIGVAPGGVQQLHQMPRIEEAALPAAHNATTPPFAEWLKRLLEKRGER